jgi:hypothetical protein
VTNKKKKKMLSIEDNILIIIVCCFVGLIWAIVNATLVAKVKLVGDSGVARVNAYN